MGDPRACACEAGRVNTGRRHTWTRTLQIGEREVTVCADCGAIWNHNNGRAPRCPGKVRVKPRAKENPMDLARYTATVTFRGYAADTDELRDRIKRALGTHPTLSLRVDEVVVQAHPYEDGRCSSTCPHGDRCTLPAGHEDGHNHRRCDCNKPNTDTADQWTPFWWESNACWGPIYSRDHWLRMVATYAANTAPACTPEAAHRVMTRVGALAPHRPGDWTMPSIGMRMEHVGQPILAWAAERGMDLSWTE